MSTTLPVRPGLDVTVGEAGHGDPVIVLHGAAGPASIAGLVAHLAPHHRVITPTHPGFDGTTRPDEIDSVPALTRLHIDLLDRLNLADVTVVGVSIGGWIAAELAVTDPHVTRLALIDAIGPTIPGHTERLPTGPPPAAPTGPPGAAGRGGPPAATMAALQTYGGPQMSDPTLLDRIRHLDIPTLLIWGENDPVISPDFGRAYTAAFPRARFALIPGAGHLPMREEPEQTYTTLSDFLTEKDRSPQ